MQPIIRLGTAVHAAFASGVPVVVVTSLVATHHRGKLKRLFTSFAKQFLEAFAEARQQPTSRQAAKRMQRAKASLDLIRAQLQALGTEKPGDKQILAWAQQADQSRVVPLRTAA